MKYQALKDRLSLKSAQKELTNEIRLIIESQSIIVATLKELIDTVRTSKSVEVKIPEQKEIRIPDNSKQLKEIAEKINKKQIDISEYTNPENPIAVRLSDGQKWIEKLIHTIHSSSKQMFPFSNSAGRATQALVGNNRKLQVEQTTYNPVDLSTVGNTCYIGYTSQSGYKIVRIVDDIEIRYYYGTTDYETDWNNRINLAYATNQV